MTKPPNPRLQRTATRASLRASAADADSLCPGRRVTLTVAIFCLLTSFAQAQHAVTYQASPPGVMNEFRYLGEALACISDNAPRSADQALTPCLHIGAIALDQAVEEVDGILGKPWKIMKAARGATMRVYPLHGNAEANPYIAVTFKAGHVDAIQLSGDGTPDPFSFSSLRLGDPVQRVTDILGPVSASEEVKDNGATLLSYQPFPISIEVKDKKIISIRLWHDHP